MTASKMTMEGGALQAQAPSVPTEQADGGVVGLRERFNEAVEIIGLIATDAFDGTEDSYLVDINLIVRAKVFAAAEAALDAAK